MTEDAWERLRQWRAARSTDGDAALEALADVGELRRLLDQAELAAVRTARRQGRSWTEIATQLGIARQSAWEKWRDLDEAADRAEQAVAAADEIARERRRRSKVKVPDVVGQSWDEARALLWKVELRASNADPDGPPVASEAGWYVTDQSPESGALVPAGTSVRLWLRRRDGGASVREPREPRPHSGAGRAMRPEPSGRAVS
jgi:hypothetical protein